jgi:Tol biopolymer transport system component
MTGRRIIGALAVAACVLAPSAQAAPPGKIAFDSDRDGDTEIYVMNADGSGVTQLTNNLATDCQPAWSPDGKRIAFLSTRDGVDSEIYVMNADGTGVTQLTNNLALDANPDWSPHRP